MGGTPRIAVLVTCHNRREATLEALEALAVQECADAQVQVYLVDAGSGDGTAEAVTERFPSTCVMAATDEVFWNAGMRIAFDRAMAEGGFSHYLWLNDDTRLDRTALAELLATDRLLRGLRAPSIVVGSVRDPMTGDLTYGGVRRLSRWRPLRFCLIEPSDEPRRVETMNGNAVLVPAEVVARIGSLDPAFRHGMGDYDYGLRAGRAGIEVWLAPGTVGDCPRNAPASPCLTLSEEFKRLRGVKVLPPADWFAFARRWAGWLWPVYAASPYVRRLLRAARSS